MAEVMVAALYARDADRPRSKQVEIGPSQLGGCRRRVMYQLHGTPEVNPTERLASIMGTAIHASIEEAFTHMDPAGDVFLVEAEVPGVEEIGLGPGHIDLYSKADKSVNDWKTTKKKNQRYFPKQQQRWQGQVYGFLMTRAGYEVETIRLISIARDGTVDDIVTHEEPYNDDIAFQAMDWLHELYSRKDEGWLPDPELSGVICTDYCPYFSPSDLCPTAKAM